jgi:Recombination endonuclease VII
VRITAQRPRTRIKTDPAVRRKWNRKYRLSRYGITQKDVDWLLEIQDYACAMCRAAFSEDTPVYIDHDHSTCHPQEKRACRNCLRGLLCRDCNTALGHIEHKLHLARVYLAALPARLPPAA